MEVCAAAVQAWMTTQAALIVICQLEAAEASPAAAEAIIKVTVVATHTALGVVLADPGTLLKAIILYITVPDLPLLSSRHPSLR